MRIIKKVLCAMMLIGALLAVMAPLCLDAAVYGVCQRGCTCIPDVEGGCDCGGYVEGPF